MAFSTTFAEQLANEALAASRGSDDARRPTGATAVYGIAGDPVAHSLTPALHAAAFAALGVDAVSVALRADRPVPPPWSTRCVASGCGASA